MTQHTPGQREYGCGCRSQISHMEWCPTHAAAPEMLALLERFNNGGDIHNAAFWYHMERDTRALLAKIEGK